MHRVFNYLDHQLYPSIVKIDAMYKFLQSTYLQELKGFESIKNGPSHSGHLSSNLGSSLPNNLPNRVNTNNSTSNLQNLASRTNISNSNHLQTYPSHNQPMNLNRPTILIFSLLQILSVSLLKLALWAQTQLAWIFHRLPSFLLHSPHRILLWFKTVPQNPSLDKMYQ